MTKENMKYEVMEREDVIKLLRLEQNVLKEKLIKEKNSLDSTKPSKDLLNSVRTYEEAIAVIKNMSEKDREEYVKFIKRLVQTNNFISVFNIGLAAGGMVVGDSSQVILSFLIIFLAQSINAVAKKTKNLVVELDDNKNPNEDKEINKENYSTSTKIDNIDNAIEFLQTTKESEISKYLKLKLPKEN